VHRLNPSSTKAKYGLIWRESPAIFILVAVQVHHHFNRILLLREKMTKVGERQGELSGRIMGLIASLMLRSPLPIRYVSVCRTSWKILSSTCPIR
jgi:hypothetical protein